MKIKVTVIKEYEYDEASFLIMGDQKESDDAYKKRLAAQEEKERKQYEKLKKKFGHE